LKAAKIKELSNPIVECADLTVLTDFIIDFIDRLRVFLEITENMNIANQGCPVNLKNIPHFVTKRGISSS
jgi:hypothetical protein